MKDKGLVPNEWDVLRTFPESEQAQCAPETRNRKHVGLRRKQLNSRKQWQSAASSWVRPITNLDAFDV